MTITNGYATLNDIKARLGSGMDRSAPDDMLEHCVEAASRYIDGVTGRRFYLDGSATARLYVPNHSPVVFVDDIGSTTGLVVKTDDDLDGDGDTTIAATDYQAGPVNALAEGRPLTKITYASCWTIIREGWASIEVTARWGWPAVPTDIKEACLVAAARLFAQRNAPTGILGGSLEGMPTQILGTDAPTFWRLVGPYRKPVLA